MSKLNPSQQAIADFLDGMLVVDAGPGTGKTHTIVERYVNLISREDVSPRDVLLLTFTRNAASEMEERIKKALSERGMQEESKLVQARTFDSFCLSVIMDSPEDAGELFGIEERLSRGATISSNDTLNRQHFRSYLDRFLNERGDDYGDWAAIASQNPRDMFSLIEKLMSRGLFPLRKGWFGIDAEAQLHGDHEAIFNAMADLNRRGPRGGKSKMTDTLKDSDCNNSCNAPLAVDGELPESALRDAAVDASREDLIRLVHDVYHGYVRTCISEDRLTFGISFMLAFALLYNDAGVRERTSYRYLMIDEFQDTNINQLMIALMILSKPNLCVVGDWKQGIYGFRYVSIENIISFEERCVAIRRFLNDDNARVRFSIPETTLLPLNVNYRSSSMIIDKAFECMLLPGSKNDTSLDAEEVSRKVTLITQGRTDIPEGMTDIRYVQCGSKDAETDEIVRCIMDYIGSGKYTVSENGTTRPMRLADIAVLCRKTSHCRAVLAKMQEQGIPAYLQGEVELMSTREGKLALAWLRFVNNERDRWGYVPIMADLGYSLAECRRAVEDFSRVPSDLVIQRAELYKKRRRVTELLTSLYSFYGLDNDITQAIITTLSTAHRGSLLSISDLVNIIEDGIRENTLYPVENSIDRDAVTIMTMHKSKGLEFEAVIIPFMDKKSMPLENRDSRDVFSFDATLGIRCSKEVGRFDGYTKICSSWRTKLVRATRPADYSEERRLMFVAMSRARQYETLICGPDPSTFMQELSGGSYTTLESSETDITVHEEPPAERPDVSGYPARRSKMGVHTLMHFSDEDGQGGMSEGDEVCGKGKEYGDRVHRAAEAVFNGWQVTEDYPELEMVRSIVAEARKSDMPYAEIDCTLPIEECGVTLSGRIDLMAVYPDRVEIHDYKTDVSDRFESEYVFQLSVYAQAAAEFYHKRVVCFIDYVSMGRTKEFAPLGRDVIVERVRAELARQEDVLRGDAV